MRAIFDRAEMCNLGITRLGRGLTFRLELFGQTDAFAIERLDALGQPVALEGDVAQLPLELIGPALGVRKTNLGQGARLVGGFPGLRRRSDRGRIFGLDVGQGGSVLSQRITLTGEGGVGVFAAGRDCLLPQIPDQALDDVGRLHRDARPRGQTLS